jgi:hypothetical protein
LSAFCRASKVATILSRWLVEQGVLGLAGLEFAAGVDEQHVATGLALAALFARPVEDQDGHRDRGGGEEVGRQADHGIEQVLLDQLLPDAALGAARNSTPCGTTTATRPACGRRSRSCG